MKTRVLFLCTGNSARSQMAEGYLRRAAGDRYEAMSAGIEPKGLNPLAVEAMREIGIDISQQKSKEVEELLGTNPAYVVTVCDNAKEKCPLFPGSFKSVHWDLQDPAGAEGGQEEKLAVFRRVRDEIVTRIDHEFLNDAATRSA
ncbi:MAG: protein-tyrosine-phosphatase [Acidobacteria bacterium]|jgi:arsenate reductase|nr:MAG: protein-tyrosine-phosphatase [Acidobacteriota bacterium]